MGCRKHIQQQHKGIQHIHKHKDIQHVQHSQHVRDQHIHKLHRGEQGQLQPQLHAWQHEQHQQSWQHNVSTGISTSYSWDSSRGKTSNAGAGRWAVGGISSCSIRISSISISIRISDMSSITNVSETSISISSIEESWVSFSLSFTLGNMNNTSRVGNITPSPCISTSNSWDSSRGKTSNAGAGRWAVGGISSSSIRISSISVSIRISNMSSIANVSKTSISISSIEESRVSFSLSFTLGNMNNTSRVGNITSSTGISTSNSWDTH